MKKKIKFPVLEVKMVPIEKIESNNYNPNKVAPPEMELLRHSIEMDGYTQPIVVYYDKKMDKYIIVDGFHRYRCAREYFELPEIPVVVIHKDLKNRMASTIRHNRARGTHQIPNMSQIVTNLTKLGWSEEKIAKELGMELDETIRLKQVSGLKEAFSNHIFSKSWEEFEAKIFSDEEYELYQQGTKSIKKKK